MVAPGPQDSDESAPGELPQTAYAVLAVLSVNDEELSAGEIKVRATYGMQHFYWSPAVSHIRRELRRLLALGLVDEREVSEGRRISQLYQTTESGEQALVRWVAERPPEEPVVVKNSVLLRVLLGAKVPLAATLQVIDARIAKLERAIEDINWGRRRAAELGIEEQEGLRFPLAVNDFTLRGLHFEKANLAQLRDTVVGFDGDSFRCDDRWPRGQVRRRSRPDGRADPSGPPATVRGERAP